MHCMFNNILNEITPERTYAKKRQLLWSSSANNQTWVLLPVAVVWFLHWLSFATLRHTTRCVHNAFCNIINQHCCLEEKRWYGQSTPRSTHIYSLLKQLLLILVRYYIKLFHDIRVWLGLSAGNDTYVQLNKPCGSMSSQD
jgi:hypothetical protein